MVVCLEQRCKGCGVRVRCEGFPGTFKVYTLRAKRWSVLCKPSRRRSKQSCPTPAEGDWSLEDSQLMSGAGAGQRRPRLALHPSVSLDLQPEYLGNAHCLEAPMAFFTRATGPQAFGTR